MTTNQVFPPPVLGAAIVELIPVGNVGKTTIMTYTMLSHKFIQVQTRDDA